MYICKDLSYIVESQKEAMISMRILKLVPENLKSQMRLEDFFSGRRELKARRGQRIFEIWKTF